MNTTRNSVKLGENVNFKQSLFLCLLQETNLKMPTPATPSRLSFLRQPYFYVLRSPCRDLSYYDHTHLEKKITYIYLCFEFVLNAQYATRLN